MGQTKKKSKKTAGTKVPARVAFRHDWSVGRASAEADAELLSTCFVDTGLASQLLDTNDNASIVLGRVGIGKSALLSHIESTQTCVTRIDPSLFSIKYICNSGALQFVSSLGVKLDPLFQALWKHVLCVEYIRLRFNIKSPSDAQNAWSKITTLLSFSEARKRAYEYFRDFGGLDFWQSTEVRIKEIDAKLQRQLTSDLRLPEEVVRAGAIGARSLTEDQRLEVISNAQTFISNIQMASLQEVISALAEYDQGNASARYYIVIDDLDTDWADTEVRHRLIRALIETIRRFRPIRQLKIVVAMRTDLLQSVIAATRDAGLQAEKLEDFLARVTWTDGELKKLIDLRINHALRQKYTRARVEYYDVFPREVRQKSTLDYMLERTLKRPRDVILFVNECFKVASGRVDMTPTMVQDAYRNYSESRRVSLLEEWNDIYPDLDLHLEFFSGFRSRTKLMDISVEHFNKMMLRYVGKEGSRDPVTSAMISVANSKGDVFSLHDAMPALRPLFDCTYQVGATGFIFPPINNVRWAGNQMDKLPPLDLTTVIVIHPMLYDALGTNLSTERQP